MLQGVELATLSGQGFLNPKPFTMITPDPRWECLRGERGDSWAETGMEVQKLHRLALLPDLEPLSLWSKF